MSSHNKRPTEPVTTTSLWTETGAAELEPPLPAESTADVCIIGAGIAGLTTAYVLVRSGKRVIVLDDGPVGGGETGRTTAHLSNALDEGYAALETLHGERGARLAADSHTAAIDFIEWTVAREEIACSFMRLDGYLFLAPGHDGRVLERELEAAHRAGLVGVELVDAAPLPDGTTPGPALRWPRQAQFHPMRYLTALARAVVRDGGLIYTHAHAESFEDGDGAATQVTVRGGAVVRAAALVVATNTPVNNRVKIHTKQAAYRSYVVGLEVPRGVVSTALFWDTADPYHYVRLADPAGQGDTDVLVVGGEDHKTGQEDDGVERWARLEAWAREHFPACGEVKYRWSGQIMEPADGLGFIGRNPHDERVFIATGDSGHGMTHGTIAGMLLSDLIVGRDNPWQTLYDPARVTIRALGTYARENLNVASQYGDWLRGSDVEDLDDISPGEGAVLRRGLSRIAVYRDAAGDCHTMSAKCPHLGGVVHWNHGEQTWDCPCHGSRFDAQGRVLNGPALDDLEPVDAELPHGGEVRVSDGAEGELAVEGAGGLANDHEPG